MLSIEYMGLIPARVGPRAPVPAAALASVAARLVGSPTRKCRPLTPSATFSAIPPMSLQITGRPKWKASWITSGEFSHQIDGTTTQSMSAIYAASLPCSYLPTKVTFSRVASRRSLTVVLERPGLEVEVRAVDGRAALGPGGSLRGRAYSELERGDERIVGLIRWTNEERHRLEQDLDALVRRQLPEETEPVTVLRALDRRRSGRRRPSILLDNDLVGRKSPFDVPLAQVRAWCDEAVHQREMRLDESLAQEEGLRADLRIALVAASRRLLRARLIVGHTEHLPLSVADRHELVERVDDGRIRQRVPDLAKQVVSEEHGVLEMDDIGLDGLRKDRRCFV